MEITDLWYQLWDEKNNYTSASVQTLVTLLATTEMNRPGLMWAMIGRYFLDEKIRFMGLFLYINPLYSKGPIYVNWALYYGSFLGILFI